MTVSLNNIVSSFFLLTLINSASLIHDVYPKQLGKYIHDNVIAQHLFLLFLIYFSIEVIDDDDNITIENFYNALILYVFYLFFTKSNLFFSVLILILLSTIFILVKVKEDGKNIDNADVILTYVMLGILFVSFVYYLNKQIKDKKEKFSLYKFIFF